MLIIKRRQFLVRHLRELFFTIYNPLIKRYNKLVKPKTAGVKVVIKNSKDEYLLVRVGYGRKRWAWPGGKIDFRELPITAAKRELKEESGISVAELTQTGSKQYSWEGKRDTVYFFYGESDVEDIVIDGQEIMDAGWFLKSEFPKPLSTTVFDAFSFDEA